MLKHKKYKLLIIWGIVLSLLLVDISDARRSGGGSGGRGSRSSSGGSRITTRSNSPSRQSSNRSISTRPSPRSNTIQSRQRFNNNRSSNRSRDFDRSRSVDRSRNFDRSRNRTISRRPYATTVSPNAWRFNSQESRAFKNNDKTRTFRPPAVITNSRLSGRDTRAYSDFRAGRRFRSGFDNRDRFLRDRNFSRRHSFSRSDNFFRHDKHRFSHRKSNFVFFPSLSFGFGYPYYYNYPYYGYYSPSYYGGYGSYDSYGYSSDLYRQPTYRTSYHYPRRYIFVSLNGYWPGYDYYRYYNYGTYPYFWYMIASSPYKPGTSYPPTGSGYESDNPYTFYGTEDEKPFANVTQPARETAADRHFEQGVNAFAAGDYSKAVTYFHEAKNSAPSDVILPFAYIQALFANENYTEAARQLRATINKQPVGSEWAFYPRGLYTDDQILMSQIDSLLEKASSDSDLQLLAGYQLLGVHRFDEALEYLNNAQAGDRYNQVAVGKLLYVLNNLKTNYDVKNSDSEYLNK